MDRTHRRPSYSRIVDIKLPQPVEGGDKGASGKREQVTLGVGANLLRLVFLDRDNHAKVAPITAVHGHDIGTELSQGSTNPTA